MYAQMVDTGARTAPKEQALSPEESQFQGRIDNDVRIDAEVIGDQLSPSARLPIKYDITNHRDKTILIADLIPESQYDWCAAVAPRLSRGPMVDWGGQLQQDAPELLGCSLQP